jgi:hypothetical protein
VREQEAMHGRPRQRAGQAPSPLDKKEQAQVAELQKLMPLFLESNRTCWYEFPRPTFFKIFQLFPSF